MIWTESVQIGIKGLLAHKLRSILTMLGVIFGVGAVIAMVSIGEGAKYEAVKQIELLGINTISVKPVELFGNLLKEAKRKNLKGLDLGDYVSIEELATSLERIAALVELDMGIRAGSKTPDAGVYGVTPSYLDVSNAVLSSGRFIYPEDDKGIAKVCEVFKT